MSELSKTITKRERDALEAIAKEIKSRFPSEMVRIITESYRIEISRRKQDDK